MNNNGVNNDDILNNNLETPVLIPTDDDSSNLVDVTNIVPSSTNPSDTQSSSDGNFMNTPSSSLSRKDKKLLKQEEKRKRREEKLRLKEEKMRLKEERRIAKINAKALKRGGFFSTLLVLAVIVMAGYIYYSTRVYQSTIKQLKYACTPVTANEKDTTLDLNSTLVQSLYRKVYTTIREDIAQPEWNNTMKLYLAYRQIADHDKYESNCNLFNASKMEPYVCDDSKNFTPHAFHQNTLILAWKNLFGEETEIHLDNIKLQNSCIGGYQYIPEREEFVEGYCNHQNATSFKVTKQLREAISNRNTITLVEDVKYHENEKMELPSYLKSGTYYYTFRLDMNYNFVFVSKTFEDRY